MRYPTQVSRTILRGNSTVDRQFGRCTHTVMREQREGGICTILCCIQRGMERAFQLYVRDESFPPDQLPTPRFYLRIVTLPCDEQKLNLVGMNAENILRECGDLNAF